MKILPIFYRPNSKFFTVAIACNNVLLERSFGFIVQKTRVFIVLSIDAIKYTTSEPWKFELLTSINFDGILIFKICSVVERYSEIWVEIVLKFHAQFSVIRVSTRTRFYELMIINILFRCALYIQLYVRIILFTRGASLSQACRLVFSKATIIQCDYS